MRGRLQFVLVLPDGSKSQIPADWTDFNAATSAPSPSPQLPGSLEDLVRLRNLTDALLNRHRELVTSANQEDHASTESAVHKHPDTPNTAMGTVRRQPQTGRHRTPGSPDEPGRQNHSISGEDQ